MLINAIKLELLVSQSSSLKHPPKLDGLLGSYVHMSYQEIPVFSGSVVVSWDPAGLLLVLLSQHWMVSVMEAKTS